MLKGPFISSYRQQKLVKIRNEYLGVSFRPFFRLNTGKIIFFTLTSFNSYEFKF